MADPDFDKLLDGGDVGAMAVCRTGFCTRVLLTDCMMTGECEMACLAVHACSDGRPAKLEDADDDGIDDGIDGGMFVDAGEDDTGVSFLCSCKLGLSAGGNEAGGNEA